ncbi:ABC transporter ATP-binding protein [Pelolinea submarina]|uniref:ATP-binding cassette subfamily B protein n=1 Tax=Pelolinea submarina TaxID=913107 RepID=A0A347ZU29_9CHLR|nr:ABC transporter ATP-binding protein [Pelolinea submarina]REG10606.1 ATP-binding cassette subfamily B protein [Pelolinea submarina]BBB48810.1 ABC type transport system ATP-binding protein and permease [Pelolinea submarina]
MPADFYEEEDFQGQFKGNVFKRILDLMRPHWPWVLGFLICVIIVSILDAYFTYLSKQIVDRGIVNKDINALQQILVNYGILILVQAAAVFGFVFLVGVLGERVRYDLRQSLFNHLQRLSLSYFSRTPVGWIMSRVTNDTERVAELVTWGVLDSTWGVINILTSVIFMLVIDWRLALIVIAILPFLFYVAVQFRKRILEQFRNVRKINSKITASYNENISGVRVVKALGREDENLREFGEQTSAMRKAGYRAAWLSALFLPSVQIISAVGLGGIIWYSGATVGSGTFSIGSLQAFITYMTSMLWPIQDVARVFAEMQRALASAERIFSLVDTTPEILDKPGAFDPGTIRGEIQFEHMYFWYEDELPVIKDLNLTIQHGETIALVGSTGGGKTTIVNLLCRFYEPKRGRILIGGHDYTDLSLQAIQSRIGVVLQTPHLFSGTIRENIAYGRLKASQQDIEAAAKLVGADHFIQRFEHGYDEQVGEGGVLLSVGQKQLISLARAVLSNPEIFIMDEATSSVDTLTESMIQKGMEAIMQDRTSIIIAHRLSTIKTAHRILVIEDGQIAEMGNHAELLKLKGKYYNLYTRQFRFEREDAYNIFKENNQANLSAG